MSKTTGSYPRLTVDTTAKRIGSLGGPVLLVKAATTLGLDGALSQALEPWRKPNAVHDPNFVWIWRWRSRSAGTVWLTSGRSAPLRRCSVTSPPTRRCPCWLISWPQMWRRCSPPSTGSAQTAGHRPGGWPVVMPRNDITQRNRLPVDLGASLVGSHSEKELVSPTYKRGFGFYPVRHEALSIRAEVKDYRRRPCRSRAVKLRAA